jgi:hypothetical protein
MKLSGQHAVASMRCRKRYVAPELFPLIRSISTSRTVSRRMPLASETAA